jgi:hypothetical protein
MADVTKKVRTMEGDRVGRPPSGLEPEEWPRMLVYRRAFALVADRLDEAGADLAALGAFDWTGPDLAELSATIAAEVWREMPRDADGEAVAEAIADALARRRPRY